MELHAVNLLYDFAVAAALLFVAKIIRCKFRFIQHAYIPAALLAGFLGLFLGQQFLDILPFSSEVANYPSILIAVLFGSMFVGTRGKMSVKSVLKGAGDTMLINGASEMMQFAVFILSVMDALLVAFAPVFVLAGQGVAFSVTLIVVSVAALIACKLMFGRKAEG